MTYNKEALVHVDYQQHLTQPRMTVNQRAAIFLPFAALSGFEEKIQTVTNQHRNQVKKKAPVIDAFHP